MESFLEQIGNVQAFVGLEQFVQRTTAIEGEGGVVGKQRVLLAFDKLAVLAREPGIFALTHLVQRLPQMADHMELIEEDAGLRHMLDRGVAKGFPHVHDPR